MEHLPEIPCGCRVRKKSDLSPSTTQDVAEKGLGERCSLLRPSGLRSGPLASAQRQCAFGPKAPEQSFTYLGESVIPEGQGLVSVKLSQIALRLKMFT